MKGYRHLTGGDRNVIARMRESGAKYRQIAAAIGCSVSTVSKELWRNRVAGCGYEAVHAQQLSQARRSVASSRERIAPWVWKVVRWFIYAVQAGPKQLAKIVPVSYESIYRWVYARIADGEHALCACLRSGRMARLAYKVRRAALALRARTSIKQRPAHVALRQECGHLEIDLLGCASHHGAALLTICERATNLAWVGRVWGKDAKTVGAAILRTLTPYKVWVKSITTDNGSEFACWRQLQAKLGCPVYASEPGKPSQRAIVEHTDGLIRQYLPKGTDAARLSTAALKRIEFALNHRPRVRLNGKSPIQAFYDATGVALQC